MNKLLKFASKIIFVRDSFNRVDTAYGLGTAEVGGKWRYAINGDGSRVAITNNAAVSISANGEYCYIDNKITNILITVVIQAITTNAKYPVIFRFTDANNFFYLRISSDKYYLYKIIAGVNTQLASTNVTAANGDSIKVKNKNGTIQVYINNILASTVTDMDLINNTKAGFGFTSNTTSQGIDSYRVEAV